MKLIVTMLTALSWPISELLTLTLSMIYQSKIYINLIPTFSGFSFLFSSIQIVLHPIETISVVNPKASTVRHIVVNLNGCI